MDISHNTPVKIIKKVLRVLDNTILPEDQEGILKIPHLQHTGENTFIYEFFFIRDDQTKEWNLMGVEKKLFI